MPCYRNLISQLYLETIYIFYRFEQLTYRLKRRTPILLKTFLITNNEHVITNTEPRITECSNSGTVRFLCGYGSYGTVNSWYIHMSLRRRRRLILIQASAYLIIYPIRLVFGRHVKFAVYDRLQGTKETKDRRRTLVIPIGIVT